MTPFHMDYLGLLIVIVEQGGTWSNAHGDFITYKPLAHCKTFIVCEGSTTLTSKMMVEIFLYMETKSES